MYAFESKRNRIIPKYVQRSVGDSFINNAGLKMKVYSLLQFKQEVNSGNQIILESLKSLEQALINSKDKTFRQKILLLGILLQAFIVHFDSRHLIIRKREIYTNKLTIRTKNDLRFRLFSKYLPFVKDSFQYYSRN